MKKRELERQSKAYNTPSERNLSQLRAAVESDLAVVSDAYDAASIALAELTKQIGLATDARTLSRLIGAHRDLTTSIIALRGEGRTTIAAAVASARDQGPGPGQALTPPGPARSAGEEGITVPDKISPPELSPGPTEDPENY